MPVEDDLLAAAIASGDAAAEDEFARRFEPRIRRVFSFALSDRTAGEDLTQEALRGALISLRSGRFRGECALATFVHAVARNKLAEFLRRKTPADLELSDEIPSPAISPEETLSQREMAEAIRDVLSKLPSKNRAVLYHHYFRGLSVAEVAREMGIPARKVTEWKDYGLRMIRHRYQTGLDRFR